MSGGRFYGCHLLGPYSRLLSMPWPMFSQDRLSGAGAPLVSGDSRTKPATQNMIVLEYCCFRYIATNAIIELHV